MYFEDREVLRHLADCNILRYDVPRHVFRRDHPNDTPPWKDLNITSEERERLIQVDQMLSDRLRETISTAYRSARSTDPSPDDDLEVLLREISWTDKREKWAFGLGALARLGELSEDDIDALPSIAQAYVHVAIAGDEYERSIATILGAEKARELRRRHHGWDAFGVANDGGAIPNDDPKCHATLPERSQ